MLDVALDAGLGVLLIVTVVWCALINRQLRRLRADKGAFDEFIGRLNAANERAEKALRGLRKEGEEITRRLEKEQLKARRRAEDLGRLAQGAGRLAKRLETTLAAAAKHAEARPTARPTTRARVEIEPADAERAALSVASAFVGDEQRRDDAEREVEGRDERRIARIEAPPSAEPRPAAEAPGNGADRASRDRRELMAALRALR